MANHFSGNPHESSNESRNRVPGIRSNLTFLLLFGLLLVGYVFKSQTTPPRERSTNDDVSQRQLESNKPDLSEQPFSADHQPANPPAKHGPTNDRVATASNTPDRENQITSPESTSIRDVTLRDQNGRVIYRGDVELLSTLQRIESGKRLSFPNDGSLFQNREGRLPRKGSGYYQEWVHPTPKQSGPGPQRIVTGKNGEIYYTHDHYRTFRRIQ